MFNNITLLPSLLNGPENIWAKIVSAILILCTLGIFLSMAVNFIEVQKKHIIKKEKKSPVEAGSMTLFFLIFYLTIKTRFGEINIDLSYIRIIFIVIGLMLIIAGTAVNISGRFYLGKNWANQIIIYKNQKLITKGVYSFLRHPLYAGLIWIFFGTSLIFFNAVSFIENLLLFIPFMYYRAKQEEKMLKKEFRGYTNYQNNIGMFFPKINL